MWIYSLMLSAFLILLLQSKVYNKFGLNNITYKRGFSKKEVFEGDVCEMTEEIVNKKLLPVPFVRVESNISNFLQFSGKKTDDISHNRYHRSFFFLSPFTKITRRYFVTCLKRGIYNCNSVTVTTGDLFGLSNTTSKVIKTNASVAVFPSLLDSDRLPLSDKSLLGDIITKRFICEDPFVTKGTREYRTSDPMSRISFTATARTGNLQVYDSDFTSDLKLMVLLNVDENPDVWGTVLENPVGEKGLKIAATVMQFAIYNGFEAGFGVNSYLNREELKPIKNSVVLLPQGTPAFLNEVFWEMADLSLNKTVYFSNFLNELLLSVNFKYHFVVITNYVDEQISQALESIKDSGSSYEIAGINI